MGSTSVSPYDFPRYTPAEVRADRIVHLVGLSAASIGFIWLNFHIRPSASAKYVIAVWIYGCGLLGMLSASALYNLASPSRLKGIFLRLDHAMIFIMIAGSYTPFSLLVLPPDSGITLLVLVWSLAIAGAVLKLLVVQSWGILSLALYLGMGWLILGYLHPLMTVLTNETLMLLIFGGVVYSVGSVVHSWSRMRFHNAIWHVMVIIGAGMHFFAIAQII
jgi:hemolysin III